jgi:hypothetical protein
MMTSTSANNGYSATDATISTTVTNNTHWIDSLLEPEEQKVIEDIQVIKQIDC